MRISDWSSDVCSSDLAHAQVPCHLLGRGAEWLAHLGRQALLELARAFEGRTDLADPAHALTARRVGRLVAVLLDDLPGQIRALDQVPAVGLQVPRPVGPRYHLVLLPGGQAAGPREGRDPLAWRLHSRPSLP